MFDVHVERLESFHVVRDDLLGGGTKERACGPFLKSLMNEGSREFLYASPFCGFAQVALAKCARELGARCTIFAEEAPGGGAHEFTELARNYGAKIHIAPSLAVAHERTQSAEKDASVFRERFADGSEIAYRSSVKAVPLGFDHPEFHRAFREALEGAWQTLERYNFDRVWLPVGSGTFARCFRSVIPEDIELCLVDVGVLPENDSRIRALKKLPNTSYFRSDEEFIERARLAPPIPSNIHYDAKLWAYLTAHARAGDLWWNVAR